MISPKLVEVGRHINIDLLTNTELIDLQGESGHFTAEISQKARFVDLAKCTSCGECAKVCPVEVPNEYDKGLSLRKAIYKQYPQAIPGAFAISKRSTAPCKATCPAHVSVQGYIALIKEKKYKEALKLFKQEHPFPGVCGRVCHHPCEQVCTRGDNNDLPVAIQHLHRFLADMEFAGEISYTPKIQEKRDEKIAIIGSGPAGLSAACFLALSGYEITVFEKLPVAGGMMAVGIPEYRLPRDILNREIEFIKDLGISIKTDISFGTDITMESLKTHGYKAVFLATGLHGSRKLGLEGEELEGVLTGVSFLRDTALGKKNSIGEKAVVIGGGNVAMDVAMTARRLGAKKVTIICLESRSQMPAWDYEIEEALEENIEIINSFGPKSFKEKNGRVSGMEFKRCITVFDDNNRFNPQYNEKEIKTIDADTIIVSIGQSAELDFAKEQKISVSPQGGIQSNISTSQTSIPWVFAGGDAVYGPKSVVEAVASGKEAAENIDRYLNGIDLHENTNNDWAYEKPETTEQSNRSLLERLSLKSIPVEKREGNFTEIIQGCLEDEAWHEADRCLSCGICSECYQCVDVCLALAINHSEQATMRKVEVGSVILCPGNEVFDPSHLENLYHYKSNPNVMTSLEFERILSASGPTMGHLVKLSDKKEPKKIAWLQCIGSRDNNLCGNGYCSSVCCMYAIKEAMIAKEHAAQELDCVIFNMDIRTFGKDYEKYYLRAKDNEGVRFVNSRIHSIDEVLETGELKIRYISEAGEITEETFDMVVLSVGLQISKSTIDMAQRIGVKLNENNFALNHPFSPVHTSRSGVYACGVFQGPKDIPSSIIEASAAANAASTHLSDVRNTRVKSIEIPNEIDLTNIEPRIGVFVCNCGINISGVIDVNTVEKFAASLPNVVYTGQNLFTCSQDAQDLMKDIIKENKINRVVVASCTPKTHEAIFMDTLEACGLNKYLFEMANIRNQDSWIHSDTLDAATKKAKELVKMAVARSATLHPLHEKVIPVNKRALVVGGGVAGMTAALGLADQDFEVVLIEKENCLGGMANKLTTTIDGTNISIYLKEMIQKVIDHKNIQVLTQSLIVNFSGFKGNFTTEVLIGPGMYERKIDHGVIILSTGAKEYQPKEFLYGKDKRVITQIELARRLEKQGTENLNQVVMIQCIGSRNDENPNCSRICCQSAVKNAIHIKKLSPQTDVYILYRDMRMYGLLENYYTEARKLGVIFFRYLQDDEPVVTSSEKGVNITFMDHILGKRLSVCADILTLSAGITAEDTEELASIIKLARNPEGYFLEAHVKLRPVDMGTEGVFVCGTAHSPQLISESISQALAAASRATTLLSKSQLTLSAVTAQVDADKCAACLVCVRSCPYGVPVINDEGVSEIDDALCQGCGVCASECPAKAIELNWYEDDQILCKVESLLEGVI